MASSDIVRNKSAKRKRLIQTIVDGLTDRTLLRQNYQSENELKSPMYSTLVRQLTDWFDEERDYETDGLSEEKALDAILFEGDEETTVNNFRILGVQHRPDFEVHLEGLEIAVEVKSGDSGSDVRGGIGQALTYAMRFDFVVYLFLDTSQGKKVKNAADPEHTTSGPEEEFLIESLWENYNVRFKVI